MQDLPIQRSLPDECRVGENRIHDVLCSIWVCGDEVIVTDAYDKTKIYQVTSKEFYYLITLPDSPESRQVYLLKAAAALLQKQKDAGVLLDNIITVNYDDADCDGYCLLNDITALLEEIGEVDDD